MPDLRSPLAMHATAGVYGAAPAGGMPLILAESAPGALAQIAGWDDFADAAAPALERLGFDGLGDYRMARQSGSATCFRIAPDKILLRHGDAASLSDALALLDDARAPALDLSHSRWLIRIEGPAAADLLARLAPVDFDTAAFAAGGFVQTAIHHVAVLIHRVGPETFEVYAPVTWAASLWHLICDTAAPFGYRVEEAAS
ncbi:MAG: hypothetical protein MJE12_12390 [Alphaproteobacteria bacterium]|nr:hypothetical protein [Alphaproteobacteria bacterium]